MFSLYPPRLRMVCNADTVKIPVWKLNKLIAEIFAWSFNFIDETLKRKIVSLSLLLVSTLLAFLRTLQSFSIKVHRNAFIFENVNFCSFKFLICEHWNCLNFMTLCKLGNGLVSLHECNEHSKTLAKLHKRGTEGEVSIPPLIFYLAFHTCCWLISYP